MYQAQPLGHWPQRNPPHNTVRRFKPLWARRGTDRQHTGPSQRECPKDDPRVPTHNLRTVYPPDWMNRRLASAQSGMCV